MGCCCHEKNYFLETDLPIQSSPHQVTVSPSNQLTASKDEEHKREEEAGEELRQSPVLGENGQQVWEELALDSEEYEGDLLRATHTNNLPISIDNSLRKRAANDLTLTCPQPRVLPPPSPHPSPSPPVPRITFGPLPTIKEEESSLYDTHRKSVNQISVSDCSQRGEMRRMF